MDREIPYSLLVFFPHFAMKDLPITPLKQVVDCYKAATQYLANVHVGNLHMVGVRNMKELISFVKESREFI